MSKKTESGLRPAAFNVLVHQGDVGGRREQDRVREGGIVTAVGLGPIIMARSRFNLSQLHKSPDAVPL